MIHFLRFEFKSLFRRREGIICLVLFFVLSLWFVQSGISQYKDTLIRTEKFQEIEKTKVKQYVNYTQYGTYGIRMLFIPAPVNVFFFNSGIIPDLTSYADSGERLKIYNPLKGKNLFRLKKFHFTDFAGFILVIGALLALVYGFAASVTEPEYLRFLATVTGRKKLFFYTHLSRILVMSIFLTVLFLCAYLLTLLNRLSISVDKHMLVFFMAALLVFVFFYFLGALTGTIESRLSGITLMFTLWFLCLFAIPATIYEYTAVRADSIKPIYQLEMEKLKVFSDFEKMAIKEVGRYKREKRNDEAYKDLIERYWKNEFEKIQKMEEVVKNDMEKVISRSHFLALFFPSPFYLSVCDGVSSRGLDSFSDFYNYVAASKKKFVRFYFDKKYYGNHEKVEPFFKGDENIYRSRSRFPRVLLWGFLVTFFYILILVSWNYTRFMKRLYPYPGEPDLSNPGKRLELNRGQYMTVKCAHDFDLKKHLYNLFSGRHATVYRERLKDKIIIDDRDVVTPPTVCDFLYLCRPSRIPGAINVSDFIRLLARLQGLTADQEETIYSNAMVKPLLGKTFKAVRDPERAEVLMAVTRFTRRDLYLVDRMTMEMPARIFIRFKEWMESLTEDRAMVIYLAVYNELLVTPGEEQSGYLEAEFWGRIVDGLRGE